MSWYFAAAFNASSNWPSRSRVCTSPDGQPVVAISPVGVLGEQSASIRGHLTK